MRRLQVHHEVDAAPALAATGGFLAADPVAHNVILDVMHERIAVPEPSHHWWVTDDGDVCGVAMQTPSSFPVVITRMPRDAMTLLVEAIATVSPEVPGVLGEAGAAAAFAGRWTEQCSTGAVPSEAQRTYVLGSLHPAPDVPGQVRLAADGDVPLLVDWLRGFDRDTRPGPAGAGDPPTGHGADDRAAVVARRVAAGQVWIWHHGGDDVAMVRTAPPLAGTVRLGFVYTPPEHRRHGYARGLVAEVCEAIRSPAVPRLMLFTQLANATSNRLYRRIGFESVGEVLRYSFAPPAERSSSIVSDVPPEPTSTNPKRS